MHSFQPSRGRIFFEVLCAVGIAASCGGAWMQTGASALLAAAAIATLYGLVHFFDLFRRSPSVATEPQRIEFEEPEAVVDAPARQNVSVLTARIEGQLMAHSATEEAPSVEVAALEEAQPVAAAALEPGERRRAKAPRKANSRRANTAKKSKAAEPAPLEEEEVVELALRDEQIDDESISVAEPFHPPVAPLFEPEPFVRQQQRSMFGRKAG